MKYKRILFKISGEGLMDNDGKVLSLERICRLADEIKELTDEGLQVAVVIGGGNLFRGGNFSLFGLSRVVSDNMGMLATIFNGLALEDIFNKQGLKTVLMSALEINKFAEFFNVNKAKALLNEGNVLILTGGASNPFFTTDTAAVIRGLELSCDVIIKGTQVNGVYDKDPKIHSDAVKYDTISFDNIISKNLKIMDLQAIATAKSAGIEVLVFNMHKPKELKKVINGQSKDYSIIK